MVNIKKLDYKLVISLIFLLVCTYITKKTMFIQGDGFNSQVLSVAKGTIGPLSKIHQIRFLVVAPFYILGKNNKIYENKICCRSTKWNSRFTYVFTSFRCSKR